MSTRPRFRLSLWHILAATCIGLGMLLNALPAAACTASGCVTAGPRLASVDAQRGALLNAMLGGLTGSTLTVTFLDWNAIAAGNVSLAQMLNALEASTSTATPSAALNADATLYQLIGAMATAAGNQGNVGLQGSLVTLRNQVNLLSGTIKLGDLLSTNGATGMTQLNALDLVSGMVQLFNFRNVATTPAPLTISGANFTGGLIGSARLWAQVIEPPVYVCGPVSSTFHSAAIRIKLDLDLVTINLPVGLLTALLGVSLAEVRIVDLDLYVEVARAQGTITAVNAIANTLTVTATPGVADVYIGTIDDAKFFNRAYDITASDVDYATIGSVRINAITADLKVKTTAQGQSPIQRTLNFSGAYPQTLNASTNASFATNLANSLLGNLSVTTTPGFGLLNALVQPVLAGVVSTGLTTILDPLLRNAVNPLLELLGIRLGEVDVTAGGAFYLCTVSGSAYSDANHSALKEIGETGTGLALYAKLIASSNPGFASDVAIVDPATGTFTFTNIFPASYSLVIDTSSTKSDITVTSSAGWIATEVPTLTRSFTMANTATADVSGQTFGLYNGSRLSGSVFKDNGSGSGTANNGVRDGIEAGLPGIAISVTNQAGSTTYDTAATADQGAYTLWIPAAAGANPLRIAATNAAGHVSIAGSAGTTGGSYTRATDTVAFTNTIGTLYTGVNFADVPANQFLPDGQQTALPGTVVFYPHRYTAGSAGTLSLSTPAAVPATWSQTVYQDSNCNAVIDSAEAVMGSAVAVIADQTVCAIVRVFIPEAAAFDTRSTATLSASFSYANSAVTDAQERLDVTIVGNATAAGLHLAKVVDKATAKSGDSLTYTISYTNHSTSPLSNLRIFDSTPAYTVFASALCGALPSGITGCAVSVQPSPGASGPVEWAFTGQLQPGTSGAVTFVVTLQ